ncbi:hypothetical protein SNE40_021840 [Patella caerulea]|uniref:RING-type domain-containing protein n=1 Tax=Patella caerulea TaxID=87958 RepID=A0AAN8GBX2_PATCE
MSSTLSLRSKIQDDHLTCTVCMEYFTRPKALPCLHTFCEDCLRDFIYGRGWERQGKFPCPICRTEAEIPEGGVKNFPDNHLVTSLSDTVTHARRPPRIPQRPPRCPPPQEDETTGSTSAWIPVSTKTGKSDVPPLYPVLTDVAPSQGPNDNQQQSNPQQSGAIPCSHGMVLQFGKYGPGHVDFLKPLGLAINCQGDFIITDEGGNRILIFNKSGQLKSKIVCTKCAIRDVAVTSTNDILVSVTSSGSAIMHLYNMSGKLLAEFGQHYHFENPLGITCLKNGYVAVTALESLSVFIFTNQYKFSTKFGRKGSGDERFLSPCYVASDNKNQLIVSDSVNHNVQIFLSTGKFKNRFGGEGSKHGYFNTPLGVATDDKNNIVVADSNNYRVEVFSSKGRYLGSIVEDTFEIGPEVKPVNVAVTINHQYVVLLVGPHFAEVRVYLPKLSHLNADAPDACKHQ